MKQAAKPSAPHGTIAQRPADKVAKASTTVPQSQVPTPADAPTNALIKTPTKTLAKPPPDTSKNGSVVPMSVPEERVHSKQCVGHDDKAAKAVALDVEATSATAEPPSQSQQPSTSMPKDTRQVTMTGTTSDPPAFTVTTQCTNSAAEGVSIPGSPLPVSETDKQMAEPALSEGAFVPNYEEMSEAGSEAPKAAKTLPPTLTIDRETVYQLIERPNPVASANAAIC